MSPVERLLARAIRLESGCLVLPNHLDNPTVYPSVNVDGKTARANRLVYESVHGPTDLHVCHTCDYPRCFEPTHLFAGSASVNMKDMADKKRHEYPSGEDAYNYRGGKTKDMTAYHKEWADKNREKKRKQGREAEARRRARLKQEN
jgi:hypothetical protein